MSAGQNYGARLTTTTNLLNTSAPTLQTQYMQMQRNLGTLNSQKESIDAEVVALQAKLANLRSSADTYDREFLDRSKEGAGFWTRRGFVTFQDWVLAAFFVVYALTAFVFVAFALVFSKKKVVAVFMILSAAFVIGVMTSVVIARLG